MRRFQVLPNGRLRVEMLKDASRGGRTTRDRGYVPGLRGGPAKLGARARDIVLTDKAHALLTRLELEKRFGTKTQERGPTPISKGWKESL